MVQNRSIYFSIFTFHRRHLQMNHHFVPFVLSKESFQLHGKSLNPFFVLIRLCCRKKIEMKSIGTMVKWYNGILGTKMNIYCLMIECCIFSPLNTSLPTSNKIFFTASATLSLSLLQIKE